MTDRTQFRPPRDEQELALLLDVLSASFNFPRERADEFAKRVGIDRYRLLHNGTEVAGGLALIPMGIWFGGRSVPMTGIAAVAVAPHHRSRGTAGSLMSAAVREMHETGVPLSGLYPATQPVYRRAGYEQAGSRFEITLPTKSIAVRSDGVDVRPLTDADRDLVGALYARRAARCAGNLDRTEYLWARVRRPPREAEAEGYLFSRDGRPEGYLYLVRRESDHAPYSLLLTDVVALTPAVARQMLTFLAGFRSMTDEAVWYASPTDPLLSVMTEQSARVKLNLNWMLRIVNVAHALEQRGYPPGVETRVHFDVRDELLPANHGRFTLEIGDGPGIVKRGGEGRLRIDIRGLAALYSGYLSPTELLATGLFDADADDAFAAAPAFAGPAPWMPDMF